MSYTYLEVPNANLVCCVCRSPFVEPCTTKTCSHTFCYECISQAIATNRQCPIDRTPLSLHDLAPADPVVRNLVDELIVKCPQERLGCTYTCQRLLLPVHLADACQYVQVGCPHAACAQRVLKKDIERHECEKGAPEEAVEGGRQSSEHECASPPPREEASTAVPDVRQPASTSSSTDLAAENAMLRLRLSALENVVHALRSEMFAVKHALGPWYRPEVQPQYAEEGRPSPLLASQALDRPLSEDPEVDGSISQSDLPSRQTDPTDLASYFPSPDEAARDVPPPRRTRAATDAARAQHLPSPAGHAPGPASSPITSYPTAFPINNSAAGYGPSALYTPGPYTTPAAVPGMSYAQSASLAATSPTALSVPPLDPTMPLPDTLASLHSSLVTLAGALGALAAARGSESLRTAEELRGMRATVHGLRMQVHDILTSRTAVPGHGTNGAAGGNADADGPDSAPPLGAGVPPWAGYGPRPYGQFPVYHHPYPPPLGVPHPLPTNITKL